jgi:hypothetical protein
MKAAPARRVIHAGTRIQVVLAVVDASGNVIENRPVNLEVSRFDRAAFGQAFVAAERERQRFIHVIPLLRGTVDVAREP